MKQEVYYSSISEFRVVENKLWVAGKAQVRVDNDHAVFLHHVSTEVELPYQKSCESLVEKGVPSDKELWIVGNGWARAVGFGNQRYVGVIKLDSLRTCELKEKGRY